MSKQESPRGGHKCRYGNNVLYKEIHGLVYILTIGAEELEVSDNSATAGDSDCLDIYERPGNKIYKDNAST